MCVIIIIIIIIYIRKSITQHFKNVFLVFNELYLKTRFYLKKSKRRRVYNPIHIDIWWQKKKKKKWKSRNINQIQP